MSSSRFPDAHPAEYRAEQHHFAKVGSRCEVCGATLSARELRDAIEASGRTLCRLHAAGDDLGFELDEFGGN